MHTLFAMAVQRGTDIIGHVPRQISYICPLFILRGGVLNWFKAALQGFRFRDHNHHSQSKSNCACSLSFKLFSVVALSLPSTVTTVFPDAL